MKTTYYPKDDILLLHVSEKPVVREISQDWHTTVSYAADGTVAEMVLREARARGVGGAGGVGRTAQAAFLTQSRHLPQ
jgi:Protein of unknown function (DUF2283)